MNIHGTSSVLAGLVYMPHGERELVFDGVLPHICVHIALTMHHLLRTYMYVCMYQSGCEGLC